MYHKVKNTLASLAVAITMLGVSYSVGRPPVQVAEANAPRVEMSGDLEAGLDSLTAERKRELVGIRNAISMPFYSFAPLLPRRES